MCIRDSYSTVGQFKVINNKSYAIFIRKNVGALNVNVKRLPKITVY